MNLFLKLLLVFQLIQYGASDLATFGSVLSAGTGFLPAEMRGIAGTAANMALAAANLKKGMVEVIMDGSDYPWICLCATKSQLAAINKGRKDPIAADQCPEYPWKDNKAEEKNKVGCRQPQTNLDNVPLPSAPTSAPASTKK